MNVYLRCRTTQLNNNQSLLEHKILQNLQNQLKKNQCNCKEVDNKVLHYKEHRDHNNNLEEDQEQVHKIINNKQNQWKIESTRVKLIVEMQSKGKFKDFTKNMELIDM